MVSQSIWVGIVFGVFFVGIGVSYAVFEANNPSKFMAMTPQQMLQMMNDPQMVQQMMNQMMQDPEVMDQMMTSMMQNSEHMMEWMDTGQHAEQMSEMMGDNHDFMMAMMAEMLEDPSIRLQMIGHMTEDPETVEMFKQMMGSQEMMGEGMMSDSSMDTKSNFPSSELQQEKSNLENEFDSCTSDWYITGYFLPIESDYSGELVEVSVNEVKQFYLADFLENVKIEGWGRTNAGNYLGWYHGAYTISDRYLDAYDNDLIVGMVAVDDSVIEHGSELTIPTLPEPWNNMVFSGSDEGPSIIGKHVDVFTGEGINAENETFRITGSNNTVCMQN